MYVMIFKLLVMICVLAAAGFAQMPAVEPGVSLELAKWRAARYSDVRYKLDLTLEKMSPVLKGTIEIRVRVEEKRSGGEGENASPGTQAPSPANAGSSGVANVPIILDWRSIRGSERLSTISNVTINGTIAVPKGARFEEEKAGVEILGPRYQESNEHLVFNDHVVIGENVIKLDFTSPILTSGSAITRYVDKEDGAEYIYSLFVPSDASTAFPVFDQPDLKARFSVTALTSSGWRFVTNTLASSDPYFDIPGDPERPNAAAVKFEAPSTKPISTYVFAFAAGPWERVSVPPAVAGGVSAPRLKAPPATAGGTDSDAVPAPSIYVRKSQVAKFRPHAAEVFRLNREGIKFLESYFDYKFPFPKYDIVLIPEFPFGGMEHAGATFLRESSVIFPQEPTKNDYISRANLIFHEAAHQWFGDTVTMKWFDDLWLKEGFAEFMAYKTLEKVMPEYNAWKVFYERNKQAAYLTDSTKGTTPIYQEIANLNSAKSAYGNIVYRKAPSFLRQAEFYLGPDKFQTAVRAFLKKHEYANAGWEDLVKEFEAASRTDLKAWANVWVTKPGMPVISKKSVKGWDEMHGCCFYSFYQINAQDTGTTWREKTKFLQIVVNSQTNEEQTRFTYGLESIGPMTGILTADDQSKAPFFGESTKGWGGKGKSPFFGLPPDGTYFVYIPNYQDYGYGIFLLDDKSRDYVLKNIQNEKDDFLRTMMWGCLWDSVREGELDPKEYVELVVKNLKLEPDESTIQTLLGRVSTAMRYYIDAKGEPPASAGGQGRNDDRRTQNKSTRPPANAGGSPLEIRVENLLIDRMQNASTPGQKITYYRSFLNIASSENARRIMKEILKKSAAPGGSKGEPPASAGGQAASVRPAAGKPGSGPPANAGGSAFSTKDRFDIVSRLIILGDPEAPKLLAELEKSETSDEAKRYAYAAKAGFATAENKAKFWNDFVNNKDISERWIEAAFGNFNNVRHSEITLPYLERALAELPNLKRNRKIFFVNGWLGAFIGGQKSEQALAIVNKFLADNPGLDKDLRLKILENVDLIERAVKIRARY